jgi:hypothetical protein
MQSGERFSRNAWRRSPVAGCETITRAHARRPGDASPEGGVGGGAHLRPQRSGGRRSRCTPTTAPPRSRRGSGRRACDKQPVERRVVARPMRRGIAHLLRWRLFPTAHSQTPNSRFNPAANPPRAPAHRSGKARGGAGAPGILQDRPWTLRGAPAETMITAALAMKRAGKAEANIVVPVRGRVPVPVGGAEVLRIVVPGTTADHAVGAKSRSGLARNAFAARPRIARFNARVWA